MWCIGMYTEWFAFNVSLKDDYSFARRYCSFNYRHTYWYVTLQLTLHSRSLQSKLNVRMHTVKMSEENRQ